MMYEGWKLTIEWRPTYYDLSWGLKHGEGEWAIHFGWKRLILRAERV